MADEQTHSGKGTMIRRVGTYLFGAARRVLHTAQRRLQQRWSEVRQPHSSGTGSTPPDDATPAAT